MALLEPTNLLLLGCALLYGLIGEPGEAGILLAFVVAICLLDALQQRRSRRALAELARLSAPLSRVLRDGQELELAPEQLRLARIGVLARWPAAVESLGSATVLAVDKTGTLTENRMAVARLQSWPDGALWRAGEPLAEPWHRLLELALLASRPDPVDAMEQALQRLAEEALAPGEHRHPDWPLAREYPLSTDLLAFSRLWSDGAGTWHAAAKGAPEAIADLCHLDGPARERLLAAAAALAADGLRVLAVASSPDGAPLHPQLAGAGRPQPPDGVHDFEFEPLGLVGLADPLRPEVPAAIARARAAGVRVLMITGDGPLTARSIADQASLPPGAALSGAELDALADEQLAERLAGVSVFARVMPEQKLRLVRALQRSGEVVAMGGDGVNDAPALRAADIGVAMGKRGTAVAREAADRGQPAAGPGLHPGDPPADRRPQPRSPAAAPPGADPAAGAYRPAAPGDRSGLHRGV